MGKHTGTYTSSFTGEQLESTLDMIPEVFADEYDTSTSYAVDNIVINEGVLYQCIAATSGTFDSTKWNEIKIFDNENYTIFDGTAEDEEGGLPDIYQQVEYIYNTTDAYINTGYVFKANEGRIVTKIYPISKNFNWTTPMGGGSGYWMLYSSAGHNLSVYAGSTMELCPSSGSSLNQLFEFDIKAKNGALTVVRNSTTQTATYSGEIANASNTTAFKIGDENLDGYFMSCRYYYLKLYSTIDDDSSLVVDMVPCYRKSDNVVGMWDFIGKEFHVAGGGTFIAGPDVN